MPRPSGQPIIDDNDAVVIVGVSAVEARGRIYIPPRWRQRVEWLNQARDIDALMVFGEPGLVTIRSWLPDGPRILDRYRELAAAPNEDSLRSLRLIQARYGRLRIPAHERPSLGDAALAHLDLSIERGKRTTVYVAVYSNMIEVLSPAYRNAMLLDGDPELDNLP
jgi:hypothetical protein